MTAVEPRPEIDPFSRDFIKCPYPHYETMRAEGGAHYVDKGRGFWLLTRHDDVKRIAADHDAFSSEAGSLNMVPPSPELLKRIAELAPEGIGDVPTLLRLDPPGHTRNRRLVSRAFTPHAVKQYEPLAREISRELISNWQSGMRVDFLREFAIPLPVRVIAHGLDVPDNRVEDFKRWSDSAVAQIGSNLTDDQRLACVKDSLELRDFIMEQIERKRAAAPADDVMSKLVHARLTDEEASDIIGDDSRVLSDAEIVSIIRQLLVAGNETTTNLLCQMIVNFGEMPDWWDEMRVKPDIITQVVEESLRLATPSGVNLRRATCPAIVGGQEIPQNSAVLLSYASANHDERVFPEPETFDPFRDNLSESLAFGRGIHYCPGAALARMEARVAMEELTKAIPTYTSIPMKQLPWTESFQLRALKQVPFTPYFD